MISRSLYVAGMGESLLMLANGLSISEQHCFAETDHPSDYGFFKREENSLFYSPVTGGFEFAIDINLFAIDWLELESKLLDLSAKGLLIALPDETSNVPFDYVMYENGTKKAIQIIEDESTGKFKIISRI